ncbi:type II restriction endonuclease [Novosphingobium sp. M1R2S20]|uniref:Type II restriction endonuclease n=1 Tax=Novosphingobium rhizovicinum TaxID=3228928 RepID=A0ABV3RAH3_9SPHN
MMKSGSLSQYFVGVGVKSVTGTEVDPKVSRGHEFQGVDSFRAFLGIPTDKIRVPVKFVWLSDDEPPLVLSRSATWYDSRRGKGHRGPEYRLYYPADAEEVVYRAKQGDTLFLCMGKEDSLLALLCASGSSIEQQLLWLFGLDLRGKDLVQRDLREVEGRAVDMAARYVLELADVEVITSADEWLDRLLEAFPSGLPPTRKFSAFARNLAGEIDPTTDPDQALLTWMDVEERLFMTYERHIVGERLRKGFVVDDVADVDGFVRYSLEVQNRRKSRAGYALGHHVEALLEAHGIPHKREATTEKRNGPDFLFPGENRYHDANWPADRLLMLGVKTSCKDRWRQVLAEADRIERKHLLTLEPGISQTQTKEMRKERLQLVLPRPLHSSYRTAQQPELTEIAEFLELARSVADREAGGDTLL